MNYCLFLLAQEAPTAMQAGDVEQLPQWISTLRRLGRD